MLKKFSFFNLFITKLLLLLLLLLSSSGLFAQKSQIDSLIQQKISSDGIVASKLETFKNQGIEKEMTLDHLTPDSLISYAKTYIGTPHCMGGTSYKCIDCSGLLYVVFKHFGVDIPHNSDDLAHYGKIIINPDSLQAGDLVFFIKTYNTSKFITHSGIYLGNGEFIHTSASRGVVISNLNYKYYQEHYIFGTRVF